MYGCMCGCVRCRDSRGAQSDAASRPPSVPHIALLPTRPHSETTASRFNTRIRTDFQDGVPPTAVHRRRRLRRCDAVCDSRPRAALRPWLSHTSADIHGPRCRRRRRPCRARHRAALSAAERPYHLHPAAKDARAVAAAAIAATGTKGGAPVATSRQASHRPVPRQGPAASMGARGCDGGNVSDATSSASATTARWRRRRRRERRRGRRRRRRERRRRLCPSHPPTGGAAPARAPSHPVPPRSGGRRRRFADGLPGIRARGQAAVVVNLLIGNTRTSSR